MTPIADNTLFQSTAGSLSNGVGTHFYVGETAQASNNLRRGLIKFDVSGVPAGATVNSVTLQLRMSMAPNSAAQNIEIHRALQNWGEGTSNAAQGGAGFGEGDGTQATTGDATWLHTFFNTATWTSAGGDFTATASATTSVGGERHVSMDRCRTRGGRAAVAHESRQQLRLAAHWE